MARAKKLSAEEKSSVVGHLSGGKSTLEISKLLNRDHRTQNPLGSQVRQDKGKLKRVNMRQLTL